MQRYAEEDLAHYIGRRFGRLTIIGLSRELQGRCYRWMMLCQCSCGSEKKITKGSLDRGLTQSCGCLHREVTAMVGAASRTHGESVSTGNSAEYNAWRAMIKRCYQESQDSYMRYGGRGITVCDRWRGSYENFLKDIGRRPSSSHSIDRIDVNGNYEPENCRWATRKEQARNRSNNSMFTMGDKTQCGAAWSEELGGDRHLIRSRLKLGMTLEQSLTRPIRVTRKKP